MRGDKNMNTNDQNLQETQKLNQQSRDKKNATSNPMSSAVNNNSGIEEAKRLNEQSRQNKGK